MQHQNVFSNRFVKDNGYLRNNRYYLSINISVKFMNWESIKQ